jgi:F-type H+-transporting ATPase subunit epsilon
MRVTVIAPDQAVFDGEADSVVAPAYDGLIGILPRHAPLMTILGQGTLTLRSGTNENRFQVSGGFLQVARDRVRIVADRVANS